MSYILFSLNTVKHAISSKILSFVLLFVGVIVSPESEEPNLPVDSDVKVEVNSEVYVDKKLEESSTSEEFIVEENTTELINEGNSEETTFEQSTTQTTVEHTIKPNTVVTPSRDENQENKYVLNTSTKKFHRVSCRHVKDIKESTSLSIPQYINIYSKVYKHIDTNMTYRELLSLASNLNILDLKSEYLKFKNI